MRVIVIKSEKKNVLLIYKVIHTWILVMFCKKQKNKTKNEHTFNWSIIRKHTRVVESEMKKKTYVFYNHVSKTRLYIPPGMSRYHGNTLSCCDNVHIFLCNLVRIYQQDKLKYHSFMLRRQSEWMDWWTDKRCICVYI